MYFFSIVLYRRKSHCVREYFFVCLYLIFLSIKMHGLNIFQDSLVLLYVVVAGVFIKVP